MTPQQTEVDMTTSTTAVNKIPKSSSNNNNTTVTTKTTKTRIKTKSQPNNNSVVDTSATTTKTTTKTIKKIIKTANEKNTTLPNTQPQQQQQQSVEKIGDGNDNKFLERVFAAMKSSQSKPPIPPTTTHKYLSNGVVENKPLSNGSRPPPHPASFTKKLQNEAKLPSQLQQQTSKNFNHNPCVNGYAEGVPFSTTKTGNNNNVVVHDDSVKDDPVVAVTLTLPLSTTEKMSTTSSKYNNYMSGSTSTSSTERRINSYLLNRSPSPTSSVHSSSSRCSSISNMTSTSTRSSYNFAYTPRRVFPQTYTRGRGSIDLQEMQKLESSPVIFDANMSFVLGCSKQPVHQTFKPTPSHMSENTSSAYLSEKIQNFLKRTDHVQEEWTAMGRRSRSRRNGSINSRDTTPTNSIYDDYDTISLIERQRERKSMERSSSLGRSRSTQNILTKAFQLTKTLPRMSTSRSNSMARDMSEEADDRTIQEEDDDLDFDEVKLAKSVVKKNFHDKVPIKKLCLT